MFDKHFEDRLHAGNQLARVLAVYAHRSDTIVLALPRGGVPVAHAIANALEAPLDIMLVRKLGVPGHEELAMGAIASGNQLVLATDVVQMLGIPDNVIQAAARREAQGIERRERLYRAGRAPLQLQDRTVILVDDGLATGSTMLAALASARLADPANVIVAVPVGAPDSCERLAAEADDFVCLYRPDPFHAVGLWYQNFEQTSDQEVIRLLDEAAQRRLPHPMPASRGSSAPQPRPPQH